MSEQSYEDFISTVSHELRTPLTSIRGFSQTMLSSWDKLDDESKKHFLKIIEEQSNRLISLVENMLSVTKIQSAKDNFVYSKTNIQPIIFEVIQIIRNQYQNRNFESDIPKNLPPIYTDKDKFQQVMINLIENAAKYSFDNSTVKIQCGSCENCECVFIRVCDEGIGINPEDYEKIFNKFSRIDNPLTRKVQGSGLGLYITKNLVEQMNGKIKVTSEKTTDEKAQTIFEVRFPAYNEEIQAGAKCRQ